MDLFTLSNLTAWSLQIALLTVAAAILARVLQFDAPVIRHTYWQGVLALCLLLPFVQTWQAPLRTRAQLTVAASPAVPTSQESTAARPSNPPLAIAWLRMLQGALQNIPPVVVAGAIATGIAIKSAWLLLGIVRLRRMRRVGASSEIADDEVYDDVSRRVQAQADVRRVRGLGQPVTFGIWKPTVLVPETFDRLPAGVRRAVLAHELWHVRRRDWAWLIAEELLRAAFWFHPAIWWLVAQVQRSREEVVDELTVLLTNARRTYLETLLRFADETSVYPAAPIAARGHLLQRMLLISKEAGMSRQRIMASSVVTMLVVAGTVGYGAAAFPLSAIAPVVEPQATQPPPRDPRRPAVAPETPAEQALKSELAGGNARKYLDLAKLQEARGALAEAETTLVAAKKAFPDNTTILAALGVFYSRTDQIDKWVATFREAYAVSPTFRPQYANALNHKAAKLEMDAGLDPTNRARLQAAASTLRQQAQELMPPPPTPPPPPARHTYQVKEAVKDAPPPPPPAAPLAAPAGTDWPAPVRVGGHIKAPTKVKDVKPLYPEAAQASRVQGVVIIEAMIDPSGRIAEARVLRGQPLLDEAALDAVKGWEFTPTQVNGFAVPVIMTVTVNFSLDPRY